jgi:hypothetical protein
MASAEAGQTTATFDVLISLQASTGVCNRSTATGTFGATVTLVCGGKAAAGGLVPESSVPYRVLTHIDAQTTLDAYSAVGTSTSFSVVGVGDRQYIEMMVGW